MSNPLSREYAAEIKANRARVRLDMYLNFTHDEDKKRCQDMLKEYAQAQYNLGYLRGVQEFGNKMDEVHDELLESI